MCLFLYSSENAAKKKKTQIRCKEKEESGLDLGVCNLSRLDDLGGVANLNGTRK
jgi:hypothetical protein